MLQQPNSDLSKKEEYINSAAICFSGFIESEDLKRGLAFMKAALEEEKIEYFPKLDEPLCNIHARHAYMQAQIELIAQLQSFVTPQPEIQSEE